LSDFGGDTNRGRRAYQKRTKEDLSGELETKEKVIGQAILGGGYFIKWRKETFRQTSPDRECPGLNKLKRYRAVEEIIEVPFKETGKTIEELKSKATRLDRFLWISCIGLED
jgi:hypothetical protein